MNITNKIIGSIIGKKRIMKDNCSRNKKILFGNPWTGYTSENKKDVEESLKKIPGVMEPFKISHTVNSEKDGKPVLYKWVVGLKLKK